MKSINKLIPLYFFIVLVCCSPAIGQAIDPSDNTNISNFINLEEDSLTYANYVFVGVNHPHYPSDNISLPKIAIELVNKSPYFNRYLTFRNGQELLDSLKQLTKQNKWIHYLTLMGHSGYEGYFVEQEAGFHRDQYHVKKKNGQLGPLSQKGATIAQLKKAIDEGVIQFHPQGLIILAGCNTAHGEENFALDLVKAVQIPVVASNQKIDLYNVVNRGEDLLGLEQKTFFVFLPTEKGIMKFDFKSNVISISNAIEKVNLLREKIKGRQGAVNSK